MPPAKPLSILILSDVHYGYFTEHAALSHPNQPPATAIANSADLVATLIRTVKSHPVDVIVVPGDLTSRATPAEFRGCVSVVSKIATELEVDPTAIFYTYGNHDTNWLVSALPGCGPEPPPLDDGYADVAARLGTFFIPEGTPAVRGPLPGSAIYRRDGLELIVLNTGYYCVHDQKVKNGRIGLNQLQWVTEALASPTPDSCWRVLALHHHPFNYPYPVPAPDLSTLEEGADLMDAIGAGWVDFVCHGHRHHPRLHTEMRTEWRTAVTFLCAGSVGVDSVHRSNGSIPNLFHLVRLESRSPSGAAVGEALTFEYSPPDGWMPALPRSVVPVPARKRFGSIACELECANAASQLIAQTLPGEDTAWSELPRLDELTLDLQCLELPRLNKLIRLTASEAGLKLLGSYGHDDRPVLLRTI